MTNTRLQLSRIPPERGRAGSAPPTTDLQMRRVRSVDLLRGDRILEITHGGEVYRLQETRLGKLILTK